MTCDRVISAFDNKVTDFMSVYLPKARTLQSYKEISLDYYDGDLDKLITNLRAIGTSNDFQFIISKIINASDITTIHEKEILNNSTLDEAEKLTALLVHSFLSHNHFLEPNLESLRARSCEEQRRIDRRRCNRNAAIGLVGSVLVAPFTGGAGTAVGVSSTVVYHVACIGDADEDYRACMGLD